MQNGENEERSDLKGQGRKNKNAPSQFRLERNVPKPPYASDQEKWFALYKVLSLNVERQKDGIRPLEQREILAHLQMTALQYDQELSNPRFHSYRMARTAKDVHQTLCDVAPSMRKALLDMARQIDDAREKGQVDFKVWQSFITGLTTVMDKFGIQSVDTSIIDAGDELDTEKAIEEAEAIVEHFRGIKELPVQMIVRDLIEVPMDNRRKRKTPKADPSAGILKNNPHVESDKTVHSIRLPKNPVGIAEKISVDDNQQPVGEVGLVDIRPEPVCDGTTSIGQDPPERGDMDFSREERQDSPSIVPEVPGEVGATGSAVGIQ